jgi:integrase
MEGEVMKRQRLTMERIRKVSCPDGKHQVFIWDADARGLGLRITKAGGKMYIYQGRLDGAAVRVVIGDPDSDKWTLEEARKEARRLQGLIDEGIDPRGEREEKKVQREQAQETAENAEKYTLEELLKTYASYCEAQGKRRHGGAVRSAMKCHLTEADPVLAGTPAKDVTPRQIAGLIRRVMEAGKERTAGSFRSYLSAAYNCARRSPVSASLPSSFIPFDVESNPVDVVPTIPVRARNRVLSRDELKLYIEYLGDDAVDDALRLALFAGGQRMAQLIRATVADYDQHEKTLRLFDPKGKRREPREHLLPLGPMAAAIVEKRVGAAKAAGTMYLFAKQKGTPMDQADPGKRLADILESINRDRVEAGDELVEHFNVLDIRRTCETMLAGLGISRDIRAQLLSHGISGVQAVHYDRHTYIKEKRAALRKWEAHLTRILNDIEDVRVVKIN